MRREQAPSEVDAPASKAAASDSAIRTYEEIAAEVLA
jgi:hypothetical protein